MIMRRIEMHNLFGVALIGAATIVILVLALVTHATDEAASPAGLPVAPVRQIRVPGADISKLGYISRVRVPNREAGRFTKLLQNGQRSYFVTLLS
jgi:hypothetical protein